MARIAVAAALAAFASVLLHSAVRFARARNRDGYWVALTASLPFLIGAGLVLWLGLPASNPDAPMFNRGFGPGWYCANVPYHKFCYRDPR